MTDREYHVPALCERGHVWEEVHFATKRRATRHAIRLSLSGYRQAWVCWNDKTIFDQLQVRGLVATLRRRSKRMSRTDCPRIRALVIKPLKRLSSGGASEGSHTAWRGDTA